MKSILLATLVLCLSQNVAQAQYDWKLEGTYAPSSSFSSSGGGWDGQTGDPTLG